MQTSDATSINQDTTSASTFADPVHGVCWKIARCLKLDAVYDGKITSQKEGSNRPDIGGLSLVPVYEPFKSGCSKYKLLRF